MRLTVEDRRAVYHHAAETQSPALVVPDDTLDVRALREALELSQSEFARTTGFGLKSISSWENGQPISTAGNLALRQIRDLQEALSRNLAAGTIGPWLRRSNPYFGEQSPLQLIEQGRVSRLWRFLYRLESGEAS